MIPDVATVAEWVIQSEGVCHSAGDRQRITPGVVGIGDDGRAIRIEDRNDITLNIGGVDVAGTVVIQGQGLSAGIISKGHDRLTAVQFIGNVKPGQLSQ